MQHVSYSEDTLKWSDICTSANFRRGIPHDSLTQLKQRFYFPLNSSQSPKRSVHWRTITQEPRRSRLWH